MCVGVCVNPENRNYQCILRHVVGEGGFKYFAFICP